MGITVTAPTDDPSTAPTVQTWRPVRPVVTAAGSPCAPQVTITPGAAPTDQVWRGAGRRNAVRLPSARAG